MVARIHTIAFQGVDVQSIDVQVQISNGLPAFTIVGYINLLLFLGILLFQPSFSEAAQTSYCLNKTIETKDIDYHYSIDFEGPKSALDRSGWTWVNMSDFDGDYDFIKSPQKDKITELPKLYAKPCSTKKEFLGSCQRSGSAFSKSVGVAFIDGYVANFIGLPIMKSYAIHGDKIIELPSKYKKASRYRGDIPSKKLAAVRGPNDELLIFNGTSFQTFKLEKAIPRKDGYPSWAIENDPVTNRDYVISNGLLGNKPFLYEITDGPNFKEIAFDKTIEEGPLNIFTIVGDKQSWIIERDGIYVEDGNSFRRIAHRGKSAFITAPADIGITKNGDIYLQLQTDRSEKMQPYLLQKETERCDIPLNLKKDIELYFVE